MTDPKLTSGEIVRMSTKKVRFADELMAQLERLGYSHCFFLAGGNSMHLLEAASRTFECVPFTHEVSAVIAAEYFNEVSLSKAWVLVTAGPGLTNAITGIAGAWLESREVLVVGGQVKTSDLAGESGVRQRGIQEVDGVALTRPITKASIRVNRSTSFELIRNCIVNSGKGRKGPVFIEVPLDISASYFSLPSDENELPEVQSTLFRDFNLPSEIEKIIYSLTRSERPLFLLGQGLNRALAREISFTLAQKSIPVATSWTGADRAGFDLSNFVGRPNFFGMRAANIAVQQADLIVTLGARLGLQQTGFNRHDFAPHAKIISIEIDPKECEAHFDRARECINADTEWFTPDLIKAISKLRSDFSPWLEHCRELFRAFPLIETGSTRPNRFINPYELITHLGYIAAENEVIVPCSSGGTFTAFMQCFPNRSGQRILSNKGLASMGYGLAGAIGAALANPNQRVLHFEGDGGFIQNMQELGTLVQHDLNLKMFVFDNSGYASIRTTQRRYFGGNYVGCDKDTGLGLPNWPSLADSFGIKFVNLDASNWRAVAEEVLATNEATLVRVPVDPEFEYLPKIGSRLIDDGTMVSNPLHMMDPPISDQQQQSLLEKYI